MFYEVFVRSFADADGDGIGDLAGLTARLDVLNDGDPATSGDLGVTGLWLMPVMASPSYHGYDVTDYRAIEPDYGTAADFRSLVAAAHERGIAVIVDLPLNHTSRQHPWFLASAAGDPARADWYVWSDSKPEGDGWHPSGGRWYYGAFGEDLPDLNLANPEVAREMTDTALYWLDEMGVDGFRLDAAKHLVETDGVLVNTPETHAWLADFGRSVHERHDDALLLGEVWDLTQVSASYVPGDLDMTFDFGLAGAMIDSLRAGSGSRLVGALRDAASSEDPEGFASFLTNHDQERVASELDGDPDRLRLAAELLLTGPGTPFIYYGEEIGLTGEKPDERIRTPMPWNGTAPAAGFTTGTPWEPLEDGWQTVNVDAQRQAPGSLLARYRDLVELRSGHPALRHGAIIPVEADDDALVATLRSDPAETLLVLANVSDAPVSGYALDLEAGPLCGSPAVRLVLGSGEPAAPTVTPDGGLDGYRPIDVLPARSVTIIELAP